jgi:hypothetical protein
MAEREIGGGGLAASSYALLSRVPAYFGPPRCVTELLALGRYLVVMATAAPGTHAAVNCRLAVPAGMPAGSRKLT